MTECENKSDVATDENNQWLKWAIELQALSQNGLTYTNDIYDKERFERIREIAAEMVAMKSGLSIKIVKDLFCNETGYQTPKLDTRAAIFQDNQILLVKEGNKWSLPGGWVDVLESVYSNTVKEVKEESGFDVTPLRIIAVQDRNKHNAPPYAYGVCKIFVLCELLGGKFVENNETSECCFFALNELPELAAAKNTKEQIQMCYRAKDDENWVVLFD